MVGWQGSAAMGGVADTWGVTGDVIGRIAGFLAACMAYYQMAFPR